MNKAKIAVTLDQNIVEHIDRFVKENIFTNRSRAIQEAVEEKLERMKRGLLARECAKLDPVFEKAMAEKDLFEDTSEWPEY